MSLVEQVGRDMVAAMKSREELRVSVLRMVKTAFKNKEIEKREPLSDSEAQQVLTTMIKQRRESIDAFTKGNRPELAGKEASEIPILESYMPQALGENEIRSLVYTAIQEISQAGKRPTAKEMGVVMKAVQAKISASGLRADGKQVSEIVKGELAR
jgi:uncharacterized protein